MLVSASIRPRAEAPVRYGRWRRFSIQATSDAAPAVFSFRAFTTPSADAGACAHQLLRLHLGRYSRAGRAVHEYLIRYY